MFLGAANHCRSSEKNNITSEKNGHEKNVYNNAHIECWFQVKILNLKIEI